MASVGQNVAVADARERVTGQIHYVLNVDLPGLLAGRILRSPHPHARVVRVDVSRSDLPRERRERARRHLAAAGASVPPG